MMRLLLVCCLFGYSLAFWRLTAYDKLDKIDVTPEQCDHDGYFGDPDNCCHYYQCNPDGRTATRRCCMPDTYWNEETCTCDWTYVNGSCVVPIPPLPCWDPVKPTPPTCNATDENTCCEIGHVWWDHTYGSGDLYTYDDPSSTPYDPTYYSACNEDHYCPAGTVFDPEICACTHLNTSCNCMDWWFTETYHQYESRVTVDKDQDVPIREGGCYNDVGAGLLECEGDGPAYLDYFVKAYFDRDFTMFMALTEGSSGVIVDNDPTGLASTIRVTVEPGQIVVEIEDKYGNRVVVNTPFTPGPGLIKIVVVVYNGEIWIYEKHGDTDLWWEHAKYIGVVQGNDWPLQLGPFVAGALPSVSFDQFGLCPYAWTEADVRAWCDDMSVTPVNPH